MDRTEDESVKKSKRFAKKMIFLYLALLQGWRVEMLPGEKFQFTRSYSMYHPAPFHYNNE